MSSPEIRETVCNRDCPDACRLTVKVVDSRAVAISGASHDPITRGFICERTRRFLRRQYDPSRFPGPMLRRDERLEQISWNSALDLAAEQLDGFRQKYGSASVLNYRSGGSLGILKSLVDRFFEAFGPVTLKSGDICSGAGESAQILDFGISESHDLHDLLSSSLILLWGKNPHTSGVHLLPFLREAREKGSKIIGIEVRETKAATLCDEFILIKPGGDFALAMGLAHHLLDLNAQPADIASWTDNFDAYRSLVKSRPLASWAEQAGVSEEVMRSLGDDLIQRSPASIQVGWGLGRRSQGGAAVRAMDALSALSGNIGVPGGGASFYFGRRTAFDSDFGLPARPEAARYLREAYLGRDLLDARDPKIHMAWITAGNPVSMLPDSQTVAEALRSCDFSVVVDSHPSDTTDLADLILPTLTLLEDDDLIGAYGNHYLRASTPAIQPEVDARHEVEIIQGLAERLGLGETFAGSVADWKRRGMRRLSAAGVQLEEIETRAVLNPFRREQLFVGKVFPRPSGRMNLIDQEPRTEDRRSADYPLLLMAVSAPRAQSSQWAVDPEGEADVLSLHPESAEGLVAGSRVAIESRQGRIEATLRLDPRIGPGLAHMNKGGMLRDGCCPNILLRAQGTDIGGGAAYYDEPVRVSRISCRGAWSQSSRSQVNSR